MTNYLIFYSSTDSKPKTHPNYKPDATGAFIPEAMKLIDYLKDRNPGCSVTAAPIKTRNVSLAKRRDQVEKVLAEDNTDYDHVFFLCHGYKHGIQFGYKWQWGAKRLVVAITNNNPVVRAITFYCCSVAQDKNNFCEWVFEELGKKSFNSDVQVFGHYTSGHTTMNPRIKIYTTGYQPFIWSTRGVAGYNELVQRNKGKCTKRMQDPGDYMRFEVPFFPIVLKKFGFTWEWKV